MTETTFENARIYSDADPEGSGLWAVLDGSLEEITKVAQSYKNDHKDRKVWFKCGKDVVHIKKTTAKPAYFGERMQRKAVVEAPAPKMQRKAFV